MPRRSGIQSTRPRHRRTRSLFPAGRHRAEADHALRWGLPLLVAAALAIMLAVVLVAADLLLGIVTPAGW